MNTFSSSHDGFPEPPELELPAHRRVLRRALLRAYEQNRSHRRFGFFPITPMKQFAPAAVLGIAVLVAAVSFIPHTSIPTPVANAQELVKNAAKKVPMLSADMRTEIEKRMKADMAATLEEALAAPDLRILTPEEYQADMEAQMKADRETAEEHGAIQKDVMHFSSAPAFGIVAAGGPTEVKLLKINEDQLGNAKVMKWTGTEAAPATFEAGVPAAHFTVAPIDIKQPVKYLAYTNPTGQSVTLGLDEDDIPVMKMIRISMQLEDGSNANVMMGTMNIINTIEAEEVKQ